MAAAVTEHKADAGQVRAHAIEVGQLADNLGLLPPRLRDDGAVVIHATAAYRTANRFSARASTIVGAYVHVITDDVPGAASAREL